MTTTNTNIHSVILAVSLIGAMAATTFAAEPPKMKMTTEIPEAITTPDSVETRLGTLRFFDGFPDDATTQRVCDNQTRSLLQTDQQFPSISSQKKGVVINDDTSVDVWFGPTAPKGHKAPWVQTVPGKGWNVLLRLYGPEQAWFDETWKPGDFEPVK